MTRILLGALAICALTITGAAQDSKPSTKPTSNNPKVIMKTSMGDIVLGLFAKEAPKTVANFIGLAEGTKEWTDTPSGKKMKKPFYDGLNFHRVIDYFMLQGGCPQGTGMGSPGYSFEDEINPADFGFDKTLAFPGGRPASGIQRPRINACLIKICKELGFDPRTEPETYKKRQSEVMEKIQKYTKLQAFETAGYRYNSKLPKSPMPKRGVIAMANSGPNTNGSQFFINVVDTPHLAGLHTVFGKVIKGMDICDKIKKVAVDQASKPIKPVKIISVRLVKADATSKPKK